MTAETAAGRRAAVHERTVPGIGTLRIAPVHPEADLDLIHGWVTQDRARFWGMREHSREQVRDIYAYLDSLDTHHAYLVHRNGEPAALFQTYEPAADPVGEYYEVLPGDIGVHLLVGPAAAPERGFTGALLGVLIRFVLADPARRRVLAEPDARNTRAIERLVKAGFVLGPEIDLPEKRARLAFLDRSAVEEH
ncbi:GNAT family N-acetyltransferase [Streptomyces palmae]|uniref:Lysine N-acyltransferase MbtK n=1 Tax=Streptomyces palmae TaxID=1701085 RepID=A0A4Z0H6W3_9ACTN|nr:GNAT family N-acetyltransferase [Streptomyces palmae]TGB09117.1 N-acetyltransferase [Streptomyces palmae]